MILHTQELIQEFTRRGYWGRETLSERFLANCRTYPERPAVIDPPDRPVLVGDERRSLTWAELGRAVDGLATALLRRGLRKDEIVIAQLPNVWELAALYLAVARAGGVLSPLPVQWREKDVGYVRQLTESRFYIAAARFKDFGYTELGHRLGFEHVISLAELGHLAAEEPDLKALAEVPVDANDVLTLCWTSGTEAEPKGCPLTHNNWAFLGRMLGRTCDIRPGDRILAVAPLVNMTAVGVNYIPWLLNAGTLVLHHPINVELLLRQLVEENIQFTILVPAMLQMILKLPNADRLDLSSVRTITTGSAPPSPWAMEEFRRRWGIEIVNIWGQNEGTGLVAGPADVPDLTLRADHFPWWGREGVAWPSGVEGIELKLVDDGDRELREPGQVGELCYRGPGVFPGYFRRHDLTAKAFTPDGFFRTGDLFVIHDERHVGFYDRKKDMVIRGGFNISSAELENAVLAHPKVAEAAVVPVPDDVLGERVGIFVVPKDPADPPTLAELVGFLQQAGMSVYKLPERLELIETLPRNPVGKILKHRLREELQRRLGTAGGGKRDAKQS